MGEGRSRGAHCPSAAVGSDLTPYPVPADLSAGPARAAADRTAGGAGRLGRAAHRTDQLQRTRTIASTARLRGPDGAGGRLRSGLHRRLRRRPLDRARDASAPAFPAAPIGRSSMSPTSRPPAPRSMASCISTSTRPISSACSRWPAQGEARLIGTVRDERADHAETAHLRGRQRPGDRPSQGRGRTRSTGSRPITCITA